MTSYFNDRYKLTHRLQGLANGLGDEIASTLENSLEKTSAKIMNLAAKADETPNFSRRLQYLMKQRTEIEKVLSEVYDEIGRTIEERAIETAQAAPKIVGGVIQKSLPPGVEIILGLPKLNRKTVEAWFRSSQIEGLFFNEYMKKLEGNAAARVVDASRQALLQNLSIQQAAKMVQASLDAGRHGAQALAQTSLFQSFSWAEYETFLENRDKIRKVEWITEFDRRTCPRCATLSGSVHKLESVFLPPIHMRCRCHLEPLSDFRLKGQRITRMETDARTVHHRDGTTSTKYESLRVKHVSQETTYNEWMKTMVTSSDPRDRAFAREALGPKRFELVSSGKLRLESLYYRGRLRSIKELRELMS